METSTDETSQTPGTSSHYQKHIPPSPKTVPFLDLSNTKFYLIMRSLNPPCAYILKTKLKLMKTSSTTSDTWRRPLQCRKYSDKRCFYWFLQINVSLPPILRIKWNPTHWNWRGWIWRKELSFAAAKGIICVVENLKMPSSVFGKILQCSQDR